MELVYQQVSVVVVVHYSVELMDSESSVLDSVLIFAEHYGRVSVERIREELTASLGDPVHLVIVAWEERV